MRQHTVLPGKLEQFSFRFEQGVEDRNKYSQMIGIWYSEFGSLNQGMDLALPLTGTRRPGSKYSNGCPPLDSVIMLNFLAEFSRGSLKSEAECAICPRASPSAFPSWQPWPFNNIQRYFQFFLQAI